MENYLLVGLGNPGEVYQNTRHNVGFKVVDSIAAKTGSFFHKEDNLFLAASCSLKNAEVLLIKPMTFMNRSGIAVKKAVDELLVNPENILIIYDDVHLSLGTLRLRLHGSDGGHNGLASIIEAIGTFKIPRLRVGIAPLNIRLTSEDLIDFVLSPFSDDECKIMERMYNIAAEAALSFVEFGSTFTMNNYNKSFLTNPV